MSREIFHCKPGGKGSPRDVQEVFYYPASIGYERARIHTDVSGEKYWTVVIEHNIKTIDELAEMSRTAISDLAQRK